MLTPLNRVIYAGAVDDLRGSASDVLVNRTGIFRCACVTRVCSEVSQQPRRSLLGLSYSKYRLLALAPRPPAKLPFSKCSLSYGDHKPVTISLTEKETKRCIEAMFWYLESHAEEMERREFDLEIARYEDLMYRFMGIPDKDLEMHVEQRKQDRLH
jgi:hypothetical protein